LKLYYEPSKTSFLGFGRVTVPRNTGFKMRELIRDYGNREYVRKWAERIVEKVADRDSKGEVRAIFRFMQSKTRYANDPRGMEYIQAPEYVLKHIEMGMKPSLDCDDYTVTGLSLIRSLGYKTAIKIVGFKNNKHFSHVYGLVLINGTWVSFDCVRKDVNLGWEAPGLSRVMEIVV